MKARIRENTVLLTLPSGRKALIEYREKVDNDGRGRWRAIFEGTEAVGGTLEAALLNLVQKLGGGNDKTLVWTT